MEYQSEQTMGGGGEAIDHKQWLPAAPPPPPQKKKKKKKKREKKEQTFVSSAHSVSDSESERSGTTEPESHNNLITCHDKLRN